LIEWMQTLAQEGEAQAGPLGRVIPPQT